LAVDDVEDAFVVGAAAFVVVALAVVDALDAGAGGALGVPDADRLVV